ncbi:MAG TPA: serine/threonine-protein kinase [Thermoanaerobaculia bacterium]|jgi:tetratricopeptide (TPR) repeat protein/tRNA A-37 threonylcarbamoyl transferase component Bud32
MTADASFQQRVEELFLLVTEAPAADRRAILDREPDPRLRAEVESLVAADAEGATFIGRAVADGADALAQELEARWIGRRIGAWRITGILGRGGMGAVYEVARDDGAFQQRAALKIVRADFDDATGRRRFIEERQILAHLNHPNIARLLDGGETADGSPFLVMEAVDGLSITDHCRSRGLSLEARLRLFVTVCRAVQFAHSQLVVHRDLKPSNILVTPDGTVKLLDFGIARLLNAGAPRAATVEGLALTPDYASPEQLRAEFVTTATDVYSLGAVLFELVTGQKAHVFTSYSLPELLHVVCEAEPSLPSEIAPEIDRRRLRGDVDTIVLTALRKDASRRYASAEQLATDIERHLASLPIAARPESRRYRAGKFVRRNGWRLGAAAAVVLVLLAGVVGTLWQARRAERRFDEVRSLANTVLFRIHDEIRDLPGSTPAREVLASTALEYLNNLSNDAQNDPSLQMELGAAYEKVGDVLGNPGNSNLGRTDEAVRSYERSLQLRLAASGADVDNTAEGRAVLQSHLKLAEVLLNGGKTEEAIVHAERALDLARRFGNAEDRASAYARQGELAMRRGELAAAERSFNVAMAEARRAAAKTPGLKATAVVADAASRLGNLYKVASRQREALEFLGIALQSSTRLQRAEPTRTAHVRQIMKLHTDRGDALRSPFAAEGMRPDRSLAEYEEALRRATSLAEADPSDFSARLGVVMAKAQIADTWRELEPARSLPMFEALFSEIDALHAADPSNFQAQWLAALLRVAYADAIRAAGQLERALTAYDEAVTRIERMRRTDRGRSTSRRDIVKSLGDRGAVRLALGDHARAASDAAACRSLASQFTTAKARPLDLRDVARCHELGAAVAMRAGHPEEALRRYDEALVFWGEFAKRQLDSPFLRQHRAAAEASRSEAARLVSAPR